MHFVVKVKLFAEEELLFTPFFFGGAFHLITRLGMLWQDMQQKG